MPGPARGSSRKDKSSNRKDNRRDGGSSNRRTDGGDGIDPARELLIATARKVRANRKLGQNFFVDPYGLEKIVEALAIEPTDKVLEIGAGLGFLTLCLQKSGAEITAVELDRNLVERLTPQISKNVNLIHGDILEFDMDSLGAGPIVVAGNIPYQITSPILSRLFGEIGAPSEVSKRIKCVVLTMQKEVALRLIATPGSKDYSHLTVMKDFLFDAELLFTVPPDSFYPRPEVNSAVVKMTPLSKPPIETQDIGMLRRVIKAGFKQRRKMLKNNLSSLNLFDEAVSEAFKQANINPAARAEDLSLRQFAILTDALIEQIGAANKH